MSLSESSEVVCPSLPPSPSLPTRVRLAASFALHFIFTTMTSGNGNPLHIGQNLHLRLITLFHLFGPCRCKVLLASTVLPSLQKLSATVLSTSQRSTSIMHPQLRRLSLDRANERHRSPQLLTCWT